MEGTISSWIGWTDNLLYMDFSNNSLSGDIPKGLIKIKGLISPNSRTLNLTKNDGIPLYVKRNKSANGLQYNWAARSENWEAVQ